MVIYMPVVSGDGGHGAGASDSDGELMSAMAQEGCSWSQLVVKDGPVPREDVRSYLMLSHEHV